MFWDVASRKEVHQRISIKALSDQPVSNPLTKYTNDCYNRDWFFQDTQWSPDSQNIILCGGSCGCNPTIGVVDIATGECRDILRQSMCTDSLSFAPSGQFFVAVGRTSALNSFDQN